MSRLLCLALAALTAAPASAQWSIREMVDDMLPVVLDAAESNFSTLRGELLASNGPDSLWQASYGPEGPNGPMYARTDHRVSQGASAYFFTIPAQDAESLTRLYDIAVGSADTYLGTFEGGLGWQPVTQNLDGGRTVVQWFECQQDGRVDQEAGRVVELIFTPTPAGAEMMFVTVRHAASCSEAP